MEDKANDVTMVGFKKRDGEHYNSHKISSPVTNDATIHLLFISMMVILNSLDILLMSKGHYFIGNLGMRNKFILTLSRDSENFMIPANGYCYY